MMATDLEVARARVKATRPTGVGGAVDDDLRRIERRARLGDADALAALERRWLRSGLGWHGERVPEGLLVSAVRDVYLWDPGVGHRLELTWAGRAGEATVWVSRRPITVELLRTFCRATRQPRLDAASVPYADARAYARWSGTHLPRKGELRLAGCEDEGAWCVEQASPSARVRRPFRVVVRRRR